MSRRVVPIVIAVLLLVPHAFGSRESNAPLHLGVPRVESGDEPHYLVIINSVLDDGDFELAGDYAAVHQGGRAAGERFRGSILDHHTGWFEGDTRRRWFDVYESDRAKWKTDPLGHPIPALRENTSPPPEDHPEYSLHGFGQALLLAPFLFPFHGTSWVEPAALVLSGAAIIVAMLFFRMLFAGLTDRARLVDFATAAVFLGTPVWHYGRSLFVEPYLLALALGAYALALCKERWLVAGALIGAGVLMKPIFALLAVPLLFLAVRERRSPQVIRFALPIAAAIFCVLAANTAMNGSPLRTSQPWIFGHFWEGLFGLLFSLDHGVLPFAPIVLLALPGWIDLFRRDRGRAGIMIAPFLIYLFVHAAWFDFGGGHCFGPRFLVPVIPFLCLGLAELPRLHEERRIWSKADIVALSLLSIAINALGAVPYWRFWDMHPLWG